MARMKAKSLSPDEKLVSLWFLHQRVYVHRRTLGQLHIYTFYLRVLIGEEEIQ